MSDFTEEFAHEIYEDDIADIGCLMVVISAAILLSAFVYTIRKIIKKSRQK